MHKNKFLLLLTALFATVLVSCSSGSSGDDDDSPAKTELACPTISPASGDYIEGQKDITITTENSNCEIYYTLDGSEPTASSSRYTGSFTIIGSKTIKAIACHNSEKSAIVTATLNLNAGKSASQLGVITGKIGLAENLSEDVKNELKSKTVYIYSDNLPGVVKTGNVGSSFYIDGLDTSKTYNFYFSNKAPGTVISSRSATVQVDNDGAPLVSVKVSEVIPQEGAGLDLSTVELKSTGTITGTAKKYNENGEAENDNAGITVFIPGTSYAAYTAKDGSFSMSGVPQGLHTIRAMYSGYTFSEQENILLTTDNDEIPETAIEKEFVLYYSRGTVKGTVILSDATSGSAGVDVILTDTSNTHSYNATTTNNGSWTINDVVPGTYSVEFHKDGYIDQYVNDIIVTGAKITGLGQILLRENGGAITGTVSVSATTELSGIGVTAVRESQDGLGEKTYYALTTTGGSFEFSSVAPGTYTVTAIYAGYKSACQSNVTISVGDEIDVGTLSISEKATYSVTGKCVLAGMESGFEGTNVLLQSSTDSTNKKSTTTNTDGVYTIPDVDSGTYTLTFSHTGFVTDTTKTVDVGLKAIAVVESLALQTNAGTVTGNVKLESAETHEGVAILINNENDEKLSYNTITDSKGHYAVAGIKPGTYRVQATKSGFNTGVSDPFIVSSGITSTPSDMILSISLRSLYGTVKLEGKNDYTGIRITATKTTSTTEIYSALSNKEGFYALSGMTPGEYILSYSYENYRSYTSSSVSLSNDSSLNLDEVELVKATGKISGIVNLEGCTDHSGITVTLVGTELEFTTEANGAYEFTVPSGNYPGGVRFEKEDFQLSAKAETIPVLTDSTYGVSTVEMKGLANTIKGITTIAGATDFSGISVTVDGLDSETYKATTNESGEWQLDHIPLGYQTIRFSIVNVPDVTHEIEVVSNDFIDIGKLEMIPDSATLKGNVFLDGMTDNMGITITVTTKDKADIVVKTSSDGAFEANNILASGSHTVTFSKDGWVSQTLTINDFTPLEVRTIGTNREYILKDTTAPAWGGSTPITINSGANFANNTKLHVDLSPDEAGSGIEKMSIQITRTTDGVTSSLYPSSYNWQDYLIGFDYDLEDLPDQYVGNGTYTLYIALKDKSGNISEKASKAITITDLVTSLSGVLTGDKLHLTEENSPYLVEADCLVSEGQTLVIAPGVEVRFASGVDDNGSTKLYSISVSGSIEARGTAEKKILFTKADSNAGISKENGYWDNNGNYISNKTTSYWNGIAINGGSVSTENTYNYVSGNIMEYCEFEYANTPLTIKAGAYINKCHFHDCTNYVNVNSSATIVNNVIENGIDLGGYSSGYFVNNVIYKALSTEATYYWMLNNTIENASVSFRFFYGNANNNKFVNSNVNIEYQLNNVTNNNFIDCPSPILATTYGYESGKSYNFTHNYWGAAQTDELNSKGSEANISFISDYYDNFNYARIDYSNWATEAFENCGYSETGFVAFDYEVDSSFFPESKETTLPISMNIQYAQNPIVYMRFAQSEEKLKDVSWKAYSAETSFTVDKEKVVDGRVTVYAQIKDSEGNISPITSHSFIYDMPAISIDLEDGKEYDARSENTFEVYYNATDLGGIRGLELYLNEKMVNDFYGNSEYDAQSCHTFKLDTMISGNYILKVIAKDVAGNVSEKSKSFSVVRGFNLSETENVTYNTTNGQLLKDANTVHLWHLDNDGSENLGTAAITQYTHTNGGFEGAASSLNGSVALDISTNAFTVEFWTRGSGNVGVEKDSEVYIQNNYYSAANYYHGFRHYYTTTDGVSDSGWLGENSVKNRSDDQWHYWAYVYGSTYSAIYCDGVCVSYQDGFTHTLNTNNNNLSISSSGIIDEIRISNSARSADEINSYYKTAKPILDANTGSLEAIVY